MLVGGSEGTKFVMMSTREKAEVLAVSFKTPLFFHTENPDCFSGHKGILCIDLCVDVSVWL